MYDSVSDMRSSYVKIRRKLMGDQIIRDDASDIVKTSPSINPEESDKLVDRVADRIFEKLRRAFTERPPETELELYIKNRLTVRMVARMVAEFYGISMHDLLSQRRTAAVCAARQVTFYLAKQITHRSLPDIGRTMGNRDHTTVLHGIKKISAKRLLCPELDEELTRLQQIIFAKQSQPLDQLVEPA